jgi:glutathione S-transferase
LFPEDELRALQSQWNDIQTGFVDEPRRAVQHADSLVASTMQQLAEAFARERSQLEQQWSRGDSVSTEDLRVAFQRYRSFFRRILSL